jgi:chromosome segregation ATPase
MTINPERAKARITVTEKEIKKYEDQVSKAKSEWEAMELVVKASEEEKVKCAMEVSAKCQELEAKVDDLHAQNATTPEEMEKMKVEMQKVMDEINGGKKDLEAKEMSVAGATGNAMKKFQEFTEVQKVCEHALFQLKVRLDDQKKALERKVREYPLRLARTLRHCSQNGYKDSKGRNKATLLAARKDAAASTISV